MSRIAGHVGLPANEIQTLESALVLRAGPTVGTWVLFGLLVYVRNAATRPSVGAGLALAFLVPVAGIALALTGVRSVHGLLRLWSVAALEAREVRATALATQVSLFLALFLVSSDYLGLPRTSFFTLALAAVVALTWADLRVDLLVFVTGPALAFATWLPMHVNQLEALLLATALSAVCLFQGVRHRRVGSLWTVALAALNTLGALTHDGSLWVPLAIGSVVLSFFVVQRAAMAFRRFSHLPTLAGEGLWALGTVLLVRWFQTDPGRATFATWMVIVFGCKSLFLLVESGMRTKGPGGRPAFGSREALARGNRWTLLQSSLASFLFAVAFRVTVIDLSIPLESLLLCSIALAGWLAARGLEVAVFHSLGIKPSRHFRVSGRYRPRILRITSIAVLTFGVLVVSSQLSRQTADAAVLNGIVKATDAEGLALAGTIARDVARGGEGALPNDRLLPAAAGLCLTFGLLLYFADKDIGGTPVTLLRGMVPLRGLMASAMVGDRVFHVIERAPLIGWVFSLVRAVYLSVSTSFDGKGSPSFSKIFVLISIVAFAFGLESAFLQLAITTLGASERTAAALVSVARIKDGAATLEVWSTALAQVVAGSILYLSGVLFGRSFLRILGILSVTLFLGIAFFKEATLGAAFIPAVFCALVAVWACWSDLVRTTKAPAARSYAVPDLRVEHRQETAPHADVVRVEVAE